MKRVALIAAAFTLAGAATAQADPYVVTLDRDANVDAVVRDAHLPSPKLTYDSALTGFAADLNGPQVQRLLNDPAVVAFLGWFQ